jgi:hypothetical protein
MEFGLGQWEDRKTDRIANHSVVRRMTAAVAGIEMSSGIPSGNRALPPQRFRRRRRTCADAQG